jgi:2'-5' RNA ligase
MIRLFVAIDLPEAVCDRLAALCAGVPGARWVDPVNFHLTLRFIGEVDNRTADDIDAALAAVRVPRFDLWLRDVGIFGRGRGVRALWAGVDPSEDLTRLQGKVENAAYSAGLPRETRKFSPHVTLARLRGVSASRLQGFVAAHRARCRSTASPSIPASSPRPARSTRRKRSTRWTADTF